MLGGFLVLLSDPLYIAVLPYFSKLIVHGGIEPILRMGRRLTFLMCGLTLPLGFGMILFAGGLTTLVAGQGFAAAASPFVAILIGGQAKVLFFWLKPAILSLGLADVVFRIGAAASTIQLLLLFILVPIWGAVGAAVARGIYHAVFVLSEAFFVNHRLAPIQHAAAAGTDQAS